MLKVSLLAILLLVSFSFQRDDECLYIPTSHENVYSEMTTLSVDKNLLNPVEIKKTLSVLPKTRPSDAVGFTNGEAFYSNIISEAIKDFDYFSKYDKNRSYMQYMTKVILLEKMRIALLIGVFINLTENKTSKCQVSYEFEKKSNIIIDEKEKAEKSILNWDSHIQSLIDAKFYNNDETVFKLKKEIEFLKDLISDENGFMHWYDQDLAKIDLLEV